MARKYLVISFVALLTFLFGLSRAKADEWASIEEEDFQSPSGKHLFKIIPYEGYRPGHCKGVLFKTNGSKLKEVWSRYLINNEGPVRVFVADSGKYVVTMDEWGEVGKLPVVIYGPNGRLDKVHNLKSLGLKSNAHIKTTISSDWWNEDAIIFFGPKEEYFFIRLHWGKMLIIDLRIGRLYEEIVDSEIYNKKYYEMEKRKWKELQDYAKKKIEEIALSKLGSKDPDERKTGALVVGQLKIRRAIPRLKELLRDVEYHLFQYGDKSQRKVYYVRKRAKEALEGMGINVKGVVVEEVESR